ncbi:MAG: 23S rRNA (adenine(2030)-N(6))-methyltransferase RlmJ [Deltaproteobacteria bacterium]|nr:23S rRNA (adenine(2030)-N(6))-methyltransferase RlmJ [Deltaproteobacteria bacterium]
MDPAFDYSHRFHAGNVGDVLKHLVLVAVLDELLSAERPVRVIETHAGEGRYLLGSTGEWMEGVHKLLALPADGLPAALARYLTLLRAAGLSDDGRRVYPGSPAIALACLRPQDRLVGYELVEATARQLERNLGSDPRLELRVGDGPAALVTALREAGSAGGETLALLDPPYSDKAEWSELTRLLPEAVKAAPAARLLLWYPVKSLTRPNLLLQQLQQGGLSGTAVELVTTPLELKRNRLNGSGMLLVNAPPPALAAVAGALPTLGRACATHGRWLVREQGF